MASNHCGPVLFREEAHFHRELNSGDDLVINVKLSGLSDDHRKWSMRHEIRRGEELCGTLDMDGAWIDLKTRRVAAPTKGLWKRFVALLRTFLSLGGTGRNIDVVEIMGHTKWTMTENTKRLDTLAGKDLVRKIGRTYALTERWIFIAEKIA